MAHGKNKFAEVFKNLSFSKIWQNFCNYNFNSFLIFNIKYVIVQPIL